MSRDRTLALFAPAVLALTGCCFSGSSEVTTDPPAGGGRADRPAADGPIVYASVERERAAPPARFAAPWPGDASLLGSSVWPRDAPPRAQARAALCVGDEQAMRSWIDATERAGGERERTLYQAARLTEYCRAEALCDRGAAMLEAGAVGVAGDLATIAVASCGRESDRARVEHEGAPAVAIVRWMESRWPLDPPASEEATPLRIAAVRTLLELVPDESHRLDHRARAAVFALAGLRGGEPALRAMEGELGGARAALLREVIERRAARSDLESEELDARSVTPDERAARIESRVACVRAGGWDGRACLAELASLDRPRAVELAGEVDPSDDAMGATAASIVRFAEPDALAARLRELGLVTSDARFEGAATFDAEVALTEAGRAVSFDTETDTYPNEHDALLVELSALAPGVLHDVVFEEIPPANVLPGGDGVIADFAVGPNGEVVERDEDEEGPYLLRAYARGERLTSTAENLGDWYDLATVLGLLNVLARARGSDVRWMVLETGDQTAAVVAGPEAGLRAALDEGLLRAASVDVGAESRDREEEMIRRLIESGRL